MGGSRYHRQIGLFLITILLPASVLAGLAVRMIHQERELAIKRAADRRHDALDQVHRELSARLEAIKLQEINRRMQAPASSQPENPLVVFTATLEGDRFVLPWEARAGQTAPESPEFARHRQDGEAREFAKRDSRAAAAAYRQALAAARTPPEIADARLRLARVLAKAGDAGEAAAQYQALLHDAGDTRDEQGILFRLYAAERLLQARREPDAVLSYLREESKRIPRLTLPEAYMIRSLLESFPQDQVSHERERISARIEELEQAVALAKDFGGVRAQIGATGAPSHAAPPSRPAWAAYGNEPWLVTIVPPAPPLPEFVLAVSSAKTAPPGVKLSGLTGDYLGEDFPGLHVEWPPDQFSERSSPGLPAGMLVAVVALVVGITVFGGYLLLRDVNRDVRLTEVRSQFVANVSHELKTPLTAIRMFAETLALGRSRNEQARSEYLETIVNESERLARLVDNVLDFSKIEQGKKIYRLRPTSLVDVANSAIRAMQYPLVQQGFTLHLDIQEDLPALRADPDAMEQAILNLLTNAMKYSGDAREIDLRLASRNGDAVIEVTDRGLGIALDEQKRVFEKFYRVRSHESHLIAGTGLGLTLVAHIAKAHGGRVDVQSAPGAGSTFSILIPIEGRA
jgi:signal transduction histidine kinase